MRNNPVDFPFHINGDMSARMMAILGEMAPGQEIYSIDESFLDVSGIAAYMPLEAFGHQIRDRVKKKIGLTIGVGFGPSKTLAKLANFAAKKWTLTNGIVDLSSPERQRKLLALVSVDDVWGLVAGSVNVCMQWVSVRRCSWLTVISA